MRSYIAMRMWKAELNSLMVKVGNSLFLRSFWVATP
jgi:hypothetical protein